MRLDIPNALYSEMISHCLDGLPNEACGFLGGAGGAATKIYPLTNSAASPVFYRPDSGEMLAAMKDIEETGASLVAIFHSHVSAPPHPSTTDVREAHYPDAVYVIVSLFDPNAPEARGWLIRKDHWTDENGKLEEVDLVIS